MNFFTADIGTTSLKTGIFSDQGEMLHFCRKDFSCTDDSFIALEWKKALFSDEIREMIKDFNSSGAGKIDGICISGNGPTVVSENGRTLLWKTQIDSTGFPQTKSLFLPRFKAFKNLYPSDFEKSSFVFSGPEYLIYTLTGKAVSILPEQRFLPAYWDEKGLADFDLEREKFPGFVNTGFMAGNLSEICKNCFGFDYDVPVVCGGPDFVTALIGTATVQPGKICDRAGSSEGINLCTEKPVFDQRIRTLPSVIPGLWNLSVLIPESGSLINSFLEDVEKLEERKLSYEEIIDYCFEDKNSEGWRILCELKNKVFDAVNILKSLAEKNGLKFEDRMTVAGGQANNARWLQEKAIASGINLQRGLCADSELTGNAVICAVALGKYKNLQEAAEKMCETEQFFDCKAVKPKEMKIYRIPENLTTIIFDIDSTLYTSASYAFEQVDVQIRQFAKENGMTFSEARNKISEFRKKWRSEHGGKKISLGNAFTHFGVSIEKSVQMRRELLEPEDFLKYDSRLVSAITRLKEKFKLICVTNNPVLPARKTLEAIGIAALIPDIIGLDTSGKSKPAVEPFQMALEKTGSRAENCLSVGDRYDMDISLPLEMGMGGILVSGVEDVYELPDMLL